MKFSLLGPVALLALLGSGCAKLPVDGPNHLAIDESATETVRQDRDKVVIDYVLVDLSRNVLQHVERVGPESFFRTFGTGKGSAPEIRLGAGDTLSIAIFELSAGGLFTPGEVGARPGSFITLPQQRVDHRGEITVPYAGKIQAAGRSIAQVQDQIEKQLAKRAIEPQVVITLVEQNANEVAVFGDATGGLKTKVTPGGERILDVIARSGIKYPGFELFVTLQRRKTRSTIFFPLLVKNPAENIYVQPGDVIYVARDPQTFVAVGALASVNQTQQLTGRYNFDSERLSLAEAVAKAGGLLDERANPGQVFLYRLESRDVLEKIGVNLNKFDPKDVLIPTVYRANYRDPSVFFAADQFPMRHKDIIYAANADSVEIDKFLSFVSLITGTVSGVATDALITRDAVRALGH